MSNKLKIILILLGTFLIGGITTFVVLIMTGKDNQDEEEIKYMATVVVDGYELKIPDQYRATILEDVGLLYWDKGHFFMYIFMGEGEYDELKISLEEYDDEEDYAKVNLDVIIPYREIAIDGRIYIYMVYETNEETMINCYHQIDDGVICQIMIGSYDIEYNGKESDLDKVKLDCEELIILSDKIVSTAKPTDEEDTPPGQLFMGQDVYEEWIEEQRLDTEE